MVRTANTTITILLAGLFGSAISIVLSADPGPIGLAVVGLLVVWVVFVLWPWAVLPGGILGGTIVAGLAGTTDVRVIVLVHLGVLGAGVAAVATRRLTGLDKDAPVPRFYRLSMLIVLATTTSGAIYGLAVGNSNKDVLTATYQIAVIPLYFLITMSTLNTSLRRRNAAILFIATISSLTALEMIAPGRHGGLLSLLPVPLLIVMAGRAHGWPRAGLALLGAGLTADVILSAYRGLWIAVGIVVIVLLALGGRSIGRGLAATALAGCALFPILLLSSSTGLGDRLQVVGQALERGPGYRVPEAAVGWDVFLSRPLFGAGLGQSTPDIYIPGFAVTDVGPVYHSFYIVILANLGLIGLGAVFWPIARSVWAAFTHRQHPIPLVLAALTCGFLASALVESPTDGHWELGLLPALTLLTLPPGIVDERGWGWRHRAAARPKPVPAQGIPALIPAQSRPVQSRPVQSRPARVEPVDAGTVHHVTATAIVVTYNSAAQIVATMNALLATGLRVVVVDNASTDQTAATIRREFPEAEMVVNDVNVGFARAVNQGLAEVTSEIVLLVNPDCAVPPHTVRGLIRFLTDRPDVGLAGPRLLDAHGRVNISAHPFETLASVLLSSFGGSLVPVGVRRLVSSARRRRAYDACRGPAEATVVDWVSGACMAMRTELLRSAGGLDERYFLYYEDEELCWQLRLRGKLVVYLPSLTAVHIGGASSGIGDTWPHLYRSMLVFFALHRRTSYHTVRIALVVRAGIGLALAAARMTMGSNGSGRNRARAWRRVAVIATTSDRSQLVAEPVWVAPRRRASA